MSTEETGQKDPKIYGSGEVEYDSSLAQQRLDDGLAGLQVEKDARAAATEGEARPMSEDEYNERINDVFAQEDHEKTTGRRFLSPNHFRSWSRILKSIPDFQDQLYPSDTIPRGETINLEGKDALFLGVTAEGRAYFAKLDEEKTEGEEIVQQYEIVDFPVNDIDINGTQETLSVPSSSDAVVSAGDPKVESGPTTIPDLANLHRQAGGKDAESSEAKEFEKALQSTRDIFVAHKVLDGDYRLASSFQDKDAFLNKAVELGFSNESAEKFWQHLTDSSSPPALPVVPPENPSLENPPVPVATQGESGELNPPPMESIVTPEDIATINALSDVHKQWIELRREDKKGKDIKAVEDQLHAALQCARSAVLGMDRARAELQPGDDDVINNFRNAKKKEEEEGGGGAKIDKETRAKGIAALRRRDAFKKELERAGIAGVAALDVWKDHMRHLPSLQVLRGMMTDKEGGVGKILAEVQADNRSIKNALRFLGFVPHKVTDANMPQIEEKVAAYAPLFEAPKRPEKENKEPAEKLSPVDKRFLEFLTATKDGQFDDDPKQLAKIWESFRRSTKDFATVPETLRGADFTAVQERITQLSQSDATNEPSPQDVKPEKGEKSVTLNDAYISALPYLDSPRNRRSAEENRTVDVYMGQLGKWRRKVRDDGDLARLIRNGDDEVLGRDTAVKHDILDRTAPDTFVFPRRNNIESAFKLKETFISALETRFSLSRRDAEIIWTDAMKHIDGIGALRQIAETGGLTADNLNKRKGLSREAVDALRYLGFGKAFKGKNFTDTDLIALKNDIGKFNVILRNQSAEKEKHSPITSHNKENAMEGNPMGEQVPTEEEFAYSDQGDIPEGSTFERGQGVELMEQNKFEEEFAPVPDGLTQTEEDYIAGPSSGNEKGSIPDLSAVGEEVDIPVSPPAIGDEITDAEFVDIESSSGKNAKEEFFPPVLYAPPSVPAVPPTPEVAPQPKHLTDEIVSRFSAEFAGLDRETLAGIEGFDQLSEHQQLAALEALKNVASENIEGQKLVLYKKKINELASADTGGFWGKIRNLGVKSWMSMTKQWQLGKTKDEARALWEMDGNTEALSMKKDALEAIVRDKLSRKDFGMEVVEGRALTLYVDPAELGDKASEELKRSAESFNLLTNNYTRLFGEKNGVVEATDRQNFDAAARALMEKLMSSPEQGGAGWTEGKALQWRTDLEGSVGMARFMEKNPDVDKELNSAGVKIAASVGLKNLLVERGGYFVAGMSARMLGVGLLGLAAVPTVAAGMGGLIAWKRGRQEFNEKDLLQVMGEEGSRVASDPRVADIRAQIERIPEGSTDPALIKKREELARSLGEAIFRVRRTEAAIVSGDALREKISLLRSRIAEVDSQLELGPAEDVAQELREKREKLERSLSARLSYTEDKLNDKKVDLGTSSAARVDGMHQVVQEIAHGKAALDFNIEAKNEITDRLDKMMSLREDTMESARRWDLAKKAMTGAAFGLGFSLAGQGAGALARDAFIGGGSGLGGAGGAVSPKASLSDEELSALLSSTEGHGVGEVAPPVAPTASSEALPDAQIDAHGAVGPGAAAVVLESTPHDYTVQPGDALERILREKGGMDLKDANAFWRSLTPDELHQIGVKGSDPNMIHPGEKIDLNKVRDLFEAKYHASIGASPDSIAETVSSSPQSTMPSGVGTALSMEELAGKGYSPAAEISGREAMLVFKGLDPKADYELVTKDFAQRPASSLLDGSFPSGSKEAAFAQGLKSHMETFINRYPGMRAPLPAESAGDYMAFVGQKGIDVQPVWDNYIQQAVEMLRKGDTAQFLELDKHAQQAGMYPNEVGAIAAERFKELYPGQSAPAFPVDYNTYPILKDLPKIETAPASSPDAQMLVDAHRDARGVTLQPIESDSTYQNGTLPDIDLTQDIPARFPMTQEALDTLVTIDGDARAASVFLGTPVGKVAGAIPATEFLRDRDHFVFPEGTDGKDAAAFLEHMLRLVDTSRIPPLSIRDGDTIRPETLGEYVLRTEKILEKWIEEGSYQKAPYTDEGAFDDIQKVA